jgi:CRISPR system Cascade subunit CasD
MQTVVFTLFAPIAAMGDVAVGERRAAFDRPGRSAVLGLVAAALGIDRGDEAAHAALDAACLLALRVLSRGMLLQDYHTIQAPPAGRKARWPTRRAALNRPNHELGTLLSLRDYRTASFVDAALVARDGADPRFAPQRIAQALARPAYTLFFGRKACPLGLPPGPHVADAGSLADAFRAAAELRPEIRSELLGYAQPGETVFADVELTGARGGPDMARPDYRLQSIERRRDRSVSRRRWQFALREEAVLVPAGGGQQP